MERFNLTNEGCMSMVWTQYGPVPREVLDVTDRVNETPSTREIITVWRLKQPMTFKAAERFQAVMEIGEQARTIEPGESVELKVGQFMRNSSVVDVLMPQSITGGQGKPS